MFFTDPFSYTLCQNLSNPSFRYILIVLGTSQRGRWVYMQTIACIRYSVLGRTCCNLIIAHLAVRAGGAFGIKADTQVFCAVFVRKAAVQRPLRSVSSCFNIPLRPLLLLTTHWTLISSFFKIVCEGQLFQIHMSCCDSGAGLPPQVSFVTLVNFEYPHIHNF